MKIRTDFVSNSSSSSFVIVGKIFSRDEMFKNCNINKQLLEDYFNDNIAEYEVTDAIINKAEKLGLYIETAGDNSADEYCIGFNPNKMKDNETLSEFKDKIVEKINLFGLKAKKKDIRFISGGSDARGISFFEDYG